VASNSDTANLALFCDYENIALGARESRYDFDITKVIERLLLKGNIVVKKAYCDWDSYSKAKPAMHGAAFEMIEIPHLRQSGKNSADIRMVVDALDLCYTKPHVDTFVILSGDSDFSPLVSKLRENNKVVIGVGVKDSTSNLLAANCDEFIFYDDLVRKRETRTRRTSNRTKAKKKTTAKTKRPTQKKTEEDRLQDAMDLIVETIDMLVDERGEEESIWGSMVKQAIKRRQPGFDESYYGFSAFSGLLEEAQRQGMVSLTRDERSGGYTIKIVDVNE